MSGLSLGIDISMKTTGPFSPFAVGRPFILLDAAKGITLVSGNVSIWADQSGNGNDVLQGTEADQPLYIVSDSDFNGNSSVHGDGVSEFLQSAAFAGGNKSQPSIVFLVYKFEDNVGTQTFMDGVGSITRHNLAAVVTDLQMFAGTSQSIYTADTSPHVGAFLYNGASPDSWEDGVPTTPAGTVGTQVWDGITLFIGRDGLINPSNIKISYVLAYNVNLSDTAKNYIGNGLAARFGTTWTNI